MPPKRGLSIQQKRNIDAAILAGHPPAMKPRSHKLILPTGHGKGFITLTNQLGKITPQGEYYYTETGQTAPTHGFDHSAPLIRRGNNEYINFLNGNRKLARSWDSAKGDYVYTKAGKLYFETSTEEFIVSIPVLIHGENKKAYTRSGQIWHTALEIGDLKVPVSLPTAEKHSKIKQHILDWINDQGTSIYTDSGEEYVYDPEGRWDISTLSTAVESSEPVVKAVLNRPLQDYSLNYSHLYEPSSICDAAFEDSGGDCVCYQLSRQTEYTLDEIHKDMDAIQMELYSGEEDPFDGEHWKTRGCTSAMLLKWAELKETVCHIMWQQNLISSYKPPYIHSPPI